MPTRKRTFRRRPVKRTTRKTGRKVTRRRVAPIRRMAWNGQPFPREYNTTFTYAQNITVSSSVGTPGTQLMSSNSLYDCDVTGTGHQPRYFDTLCGANSTAAPYNSYRVYKSTCSLEAMATTDSITARGFIGLGFFSSAGTPPSSLQEMRERRDYKTKFMGIYTGGKEICRMRQTRHNKYIFGIKDMKDDEETAAAYNASPVKAGRWAITYVPFNESSSAVIQVLVRVTYYVTLFTMNDVSDS